MTDATGVEGTAYPSRTHEFTLGFWWSSCCSIFNYLWRALWIIGSFGHCVVCPL